MPRLSAIPSTCQSIIHSFIHPPMQPTIHPSIHISVSYYFPCFQQAFRASASQTIMGDFLNEMPVYSNTSTAKRVYGRHTHMHIHMVDHKYAGLSLAHLNSVLSFSLTRSLIICLSSLYVLYVLSLSASHSASLCLSLHLSLSHSLSVSLPASLALCVSLSG